MPERSDIKEWALKWVEGSILSYIKGRTSLNILLGRIKKAVNSYGVSREDVLELIGLIQTSPIYLPALSPKEKAAKLKPLKDRLKELWREK